MKRTSLCFASVFLIILFSVTAVHAAPGAWSLSGLVGYHLIDGGLELNDDLSYSLAVGYDLTTNWTIEAGMSYTPTDSDFSNGENEDVDIWTFTGGALYRFQPWGRFTPYAQAGIGGIVYDFDQTDTDEDYMGFWGGGVMYPFSRNTALRFDLRHILNYRSDDSFNSQDDSDWRHHLISSVGIIYKFGN